MKSFKEFVKDIKEEAPTNSAGSGQVAGLGVGPDGEPPAKKRKKKMMRRKECPGLVR